MRGLKLNYAGRGERDILPVRVKVNMLDGPTYTPWIEDYQVYNAIKSTKKTRSTRVPGDLPKKLLNAYSVEFAKPIAILFRSILKTNKWPSKWTIEHGLALKKVKVPATESDLRTISLTSFW